MENKDEKLIRAEVVREILIALEKRETPDFVYKIINEVMKTLSNKVKFNGKKRSISQIMLEQAREVVRFILNQSEEFKTFIWGD